MFAGSFMVKEYLEKVRDEYINRKTELTYLSKQCQTRYKENMEMIRILEEQTDPNIESFSPRGVTGYSLEKIKVLQEEQKILTEELASIREQIFEVEVEIMEVESVIKVSREKNLDDASIDSPRTEISSSSGKFMILQTQEAERQRIARDLHDTTVQSLTSLVHKSELCMKLIDMDPIRCKLELISMSKILREVIDDARKMIYDLRPMSMDDIGFDVTLERALDKLKSSTNVNFIFNVEGDPYEIDPVIGLTLLRVVQEAYSNAVKHGHASLVKIDFNYLPDKIYLVISDDGSGFDPSSVPENVRSNNSGFGLSMMKDRIYLLSGDLTFESEKGKGCTIKVEVPIFKEES